MNKILGGLLIAMNIVTFAAYGMDKWKAQHNHWRISEATLLALAFFRGSLGAVASMRFFHHKTKHWKFRICVPLFFFFHVALLMWLCPQTLQAQPRRFNPTYPDMHDPVMALGEDGRYHIFSTGMGIQHISSVDLVTWQREQAPLAEAPAWAKRLVPAYRGHTWAPDIQKVGNRWVLYYSCSTFGKNISAIGMATNNTLDPTSPDYKWEDKGLVIQSQPKKNNWNAIDPNLILDEKNRPWLTFGSFWDGIQLVQLKKDLKTPKGKPVTIARRAKGKAIEAPFITYRDGYYYLFVSYDLCCKGLESTYKVAVGRSRNVEGPYLDREGRSMVEGGGTVITSENDQYVAQGHCSVYEFNGTWYYVAHGYDKSLRGASKLILTPFVWVDGWPVLDKVD